MTPRHCLTFDVEEHFQVSAFDTPSRRSEWEGLESRVEANTDRVLGLLADREVRATFFVLGWIAERHPAVVRAIARQGHEIASHGYAHKLITSQTPEEFRSDIRKTKRILEELSGTPVMGYRAPSFTVTRQTAWALPILVEEGYSYDSSIFPIHHDRYGMPGANPLPHRLETEAGPIWELPPSTLEVVGVRVPIAGGGYFRLCPYPLLRRFLKKAESLRHSLVMYLHPWELDPEQPRMQGPLLSRFRHYVNLHKTKGRVSQLLEDFRFQPVREAFSLELAADETTVAREPVTAPGLPLRASL